MAVVRHKKVISSGRKFKARVSKTRNVRLESDPMDFFA